MLNERRKDLRDVRPARQARIVILLLMVVGIALDCFGDNSDMRAVGTLALGFGCGILIGPRLAIWKA